MELNVGDLFDVDEVHVEMLFAGNTDITANPVNNYSVVMRLSDLTKSVLFTGDVGKDAGDYLAATLDPRKLKADYVQMAHHGQGCAEKNFYALVEAKYALWPTPLWLWDVDTGGGFGSRSWTTIETRQWMDELGVVLNYVSGLSGLIEIK